MLPEWGSKVALKVLPYSIRSIVVPQIGHLTTKKLCALAVNRRLLGFVVVPEQGVQREQGQQAWSLMRRVVVIQRFFGRT